MAIPFFKNTVAGDLFYVAAMFGIYEFVSRYFLNPKLVESENK
jgi:predicted PurR-regulated permease PerM